MTIYTLSLLRLSKINKNKRNKHDSKGAWRCVCSAFQVHGTKGLRTKQIDELDGTHTCAHVYIHTVIERVRTAAVVLVSALSVRFIDTGSI